jgi:type II secretory ATPase GspE/PulE/Tfp pilus assembly ATPase PilB-like protein
MARIFFAQNNGKDLAIGGLQGMKTTRLPWRTGTFEVWRLTEDDRQTILSAGNEPELRKQLADRKHHFLLDDALVKLKEGATSLEEVKCIAGGIRSRPRSQRA